MNTVNNHAFVEFSKTHNKEFTIGGVTLIRPDFWHTEDNQEKYEANVNKLETNPQVATVLISSPTLKIAKGEKVFLHYMAREWAEDMVIDGMEGSMIQGDYILFKILPDNSFEMRENTFLGERIFTGEQQSASGIIFDLGHRAVASTIKITHVPKELTKEYGSEKREYKEMRWVKKGDTVVTVDDKQYIFEHEGKSYVKLTVDEITGKV